MDASPDLAFHIISPLGGDDGHNKGGQASLFLAQYLLSTHSGGAPLEIVVKRTIAKTREQLEQAEQEVSLLRKANHVNIIKYIGAFTKPLDGGGREISLLIEYCNAGNLLTYSQSRIQHGRPLTELEIVQLFVQSCRGVEHLHVMGVTHRDIKLENLLLTYDDTGNSSKLIVKICDLGSATTRRGRASTKQERAAMEAEVERLTTQSYRAPELVDLFSRKVVSEQVDIWALGCVLYALAYSIHAFSENLAILNLKYNIPSTPSYSVELRGLFPWMFDPEPSTRPQIGDVVDELDELLGNKIKVFAKARGSGRGERSYMGAWANRSPLPLETAVQTHANDALLWALEESTPLPPSPPQQQQQQQQSQQQQTTRGAAYLHDTTNAIPVGGGRSGALESRKGKRNAAPLLPSSNPFKTATQGAAMMKPTSNTPPPPPLLTPPDEWHPQFPANNNNNNTKSNNPFDDLPPSFDPTFFSTPGMSSTSLVGFPEHIVSEGATAAAAAAAPASSFHVLHDSSTLSFNYPSSSITSLHTAAAGMGTTDNMWATTLGSSSTHTLPAVGVSRVPPPSHAPIFFSDPPPTYHQSSSR